MRFAVVSWVFVAAVIIGACDQPPYIPPKETEDTAGDDTVTPTCDVQATLSSLKVEYFKRSCVFSSCHDKRSAEGGLDLSADLLHAQLVGVPAEDEKAGPRGKLRVVAGDPGASFIVQKVEGTMANDEGTWMPDGTDEAVDPECSIKMLKQWISDGALDN
jgi:hypothetical protein